MAMADRSMIDTVFWAPRIWKDVGLRFLSLLGIR